MDEFSGLKLTPTKIKLLQEAKIFCNDDLITYYPTRYEEKISKPYEQWLKDEKVFFIAKIIRAPVKVFLPKKRSMITFQVFYQEQIINCVIFNRAWAMSLKINQEIFIEAKVTSYNKIVVLNYTSNIEQELFGLKPIYSHKGKLTSNLINKYISQVLLEENEIVDYIPLKLKEQYRLLDRKQALRLIHQPKNKQHILLAKRTLKYHEFLLYYLMLELAKQNNQDKNQEKKVKHFSEDEIFALCNRFPYSLTNDQFIAIRDILIDLKKKEIMYRLLQGDVGCGKTVVAAMAMYACALAKQQACMMAPTEILAKQHYASLKNIFRSCNLKIEVLYASLSTREKNDILKRLALGEIDLICGTHSLFQKKVKFKNLGLVVTDEQHRFGVEQREKLWEKGNSADFLLMSATPIPRTLASAIYGNLAVSTIQTMPKERKGCITKLIKQNSIQEIMPEIIKELQANRQIYIVCSAIDETTVKMRNVLDIYTKLKNAFASYGNVALLHGKLSSIEKEKVMKDFISNQVQILVTTTVIEVGVNVKNASMMIIYDAHRFGLSQLHQLRGRVKRGDLQGYCYLLTNSKEQESLDRLEILVKYDDGFAISYEDLKLRGPGDILGTAQTGLLQFSLGNIINDHKMMEIAQNDAKNIFKEKDLLENKKIINYCQDKIIKKK